MIPEAVRSAVTSATGARIVAARTLSGGSIAAAFEVDLSDRRPAFLKTHPSLPALAFQREAEGLAWLAETRTVRVPGVIAVSETEPGFLLLERIETGSRAGRDADAAFGRALAALHRAGAATFGGPHDNFLATLPQDNTPTDQWAAFYRDRRLEPLLSLATGRGLVAPELATHMACLFESMSEHVGPAEPPARLHGDLWGGNRVVDTHGHSFLIDPAVYGGHREIDLAMMRLFGGFSACVFAAYEEAFPLAPGHQDRVPLYQLYPLLAHLVMFGRSYASQVTEAVDLVLRRAR